MERYRLAALAALLLFQPTSNAHGFAGEEGASFLSIPVGAGPVSLGSAYSAWANDAYAPVWNPGGLGFLDSTQIGAMHQLYVEDTNYEFLSVVHPIRPGYALGISAQYFRPGDITATDALGNEIGTFSGNYGAYTIAYGQKLTDSLALGVSGKMIHAKIDDVSATAYGADVGAYFHPWRRWTFALVGANLGQKLKFLDQEDPLPQQVRAGATCLLPWALKLAAEVSHTADEDLGYHVGMAWPSEDDPGFMVRTGYSSDRTKELSQLAGFAMGVAIPFWNHEISYAWMPLSDFGNAHYFSLVLRFGAPPRDSILRPGEGSQSYGLLGEEFDLGQPRTKEAE